VTSQDIGDMLSQAAIFALFAVGMPLVILSSGINLRAM
jgi:ribose/xylose/arabinose/galactoside ABC-type transport system permease subunit